MVLIIFKLGYPPIPRALANLRLSELCEYSKGADESLQPPASTGSVDRLTELRILSAALAHTARNVEDRSEWQTCFRGDLAATHSFS
jgi:hypothetical protein